MLLFFLSLLTNPVDHRSDRCYMEPVDTPYGIVVTDDRCSAIYLVNNNTTKKLISAPGCGRYFTVSAAGNRVGFKIITENGFQTPAVLDLSSGTLTRLHEPVERAGQVSFSQDGKVAFTIGTELFVSNQGSVTRYDLGEYANLTPISPDAGHAVYNDGQDKLWTLDLQTREKTCITDQRRGYCRPAWSPDSRLIVYSTMNGELLVHQLSDGMTFEIGPGWDPHWSADSKYIIYHREETDGHQMVNSDIYLDRFDGRESRRLTFTRDRMEMDASFISDSRVIFHTCDRREIIHGKIVARGLSSLEIIATLPTPLTADNPYPRPDFGPRDSIDVPYLNQVYDTPDWHDGHWSCAPTTAMMAIAYYRKLPYWDCWCSQPSGHESHFGNYICDDYNYREMTYDLVSQDAAGNDCWGGYGYMWYNGYSPYSRMMNYIAYHDITSWSDDSPTWSETAAEVQAGWPYCMCVGLTTAGHLILAVGQVLDWHTLIFNDPYGNKNLPGYPNYYGKYARYDWPGYNNGYENLNQVHWCRGSRGGWEPAPDTLVDDLQYQYPPEATGFYMFNDPPSNQRYFHDGLTGFRGHMWWTYTTVSTDTCYVTWTPALPGAGTYEVLAYIPGSNANADARYQVHYSGGTQIVDIDQSAYSDQWISLGTFTFESSGGYVYLGDASGTGSQHIAFDALRWHQVIGIEEARSRSANSLKLASVLVKRDLTFFISGPNGDKIGYAIYDIDGRRVLEGRAEQDASDQPVTIDVSCLPAGVYFLNVAGGQSGSITTNKFIKLQ